MSDDAFATILRAARRGDEDAWSQLYAELGPPVLGYLRAQRAPEPEDVASEVFLDVVRRLHQFEGDERGFRSWVFTIAHNRMIDAHRRRGRRPVEPAADDELAAHLPSTSLEPEVMDRAAVDAIAALLDELTEDQRAVLTLRLLGGLTLPEIARIVGRSVGATKALQRRGLDALRAHIESVGAYPFGADGR